MTDYQAIYEQRFVKNLQRYLSLRKRIKQRIDQILINPYLNTELLADASGEIYKVVVVHVLTTISVSSSLFARNVEWFLNVSIAFASIYLTIQLYFLLLAHMNVLII